MKHAIHCSSVILAAALSAPALQAQTTSLVSVSSSGAQVNLECHDPSISADGRYVSFMSIASTLVAGDTNWSPDIFVRDLLNGTTERVSVSSAGAEGNGLSEYPAISADGRFVAFVSSAPNLVAGDTNNLRDVFVRDRLLGTTERVSVAWNGAESDGDSYFWTAISADGTCVAFSSDATNLVPGDVNLLRDVFVRNRQLGTTDRVSVSSAGVGGYGDSWQPALSSDGRIVAFASAAYNLVPGDLNGHDDTFVHDRLLGTTVRVSVDSFGAEGIGDSSKPSISDDGLFVAFTTSAQLAPNDSGGHWDIYVHDLQSNATECVSVTSAGIQGNGDNGYSSISAGGRYVAFNSSSSNLDAGDTNLVRDIYVHDRLSATTTRFSVSTTGTQASGDSDRPSISGDGRLVAFESRASDLVTGDLDGVPDIFLRDSGTPPPSGFCYGDGSSVACPCGNNGASGRGCENSGATGGAVLAATGTASLSNDTLLLTSSGELPSVTSVFLQGTLSVTGVSFGDGLRCAGGVLKRLYVHNASGGVVSAPQGGDPSVHARSAALGDTLSTGSTRYYQTYYRDPALTFCANPPGNSWNISSGVTVVWN